LLPNQNIFSGFCFDEIFQLKVNLQLEKGEQMVKRLPNKPEE